MDQEASSVPSSRRNSTASTASSVSIPTHISQQFKVQLKEYIPKSITDLTEEKEVLKTHIHPKIEKFFIEKCSIWKIILRDEEKRKQTIPSFSQKWFSLLQKNGVQFWSLNKPSSENPVEQVLIFYPRVVKLEYQINFKLFSISSAISTYMSSMQKIQQKIDQYYKRDHYFWIFHPSPLDVVLSNSELISSFIEYAKLHQNHIIWDVQSLQQANFLINNYGFELLEEINLLNVEEISNEIDLPKYDESHPNKVWIVRKHIISYNGIPDEVDTNNLLSKEELEKLDEKIKNQNERIKEKQKLKEEKLKEEKQRKEKVDIILKRNMERMKKEQSENKAPQALNSRSQVPQKNTTAKSDEILPEADTYDTIEVNKQPVELGEEDEKHIQEIPQQILKSEKQSKGYDEIPEPNKSKSALKEQKESDIKASDDTYS